MKELLVCCCLLFSLSVFAQTPAEPQDGRSADAARVLTVACWNVHNYMIKNRHLHGVYRPDYPKPEVEKNALREALHAVKPDIALLQEVGGEAFLNELRRDLKSEGLDYPYWGILKRAEETRLLAFISREPITGMRLIDKLDFKYGSERKRVKRGLMELHFETAGIEWMLFNVHLKSRYTSDESDPDSRLFREREARAIRDYIRSTYPPESKPRYWVMGDFNAHVNDDPLERFLEVGGHELMRELPVFDPQGERWTYFNERKRVYEQVDFILGSPAMLEHCVPSGNTQDAPGERSAGFIYPDVKKGSDHRMIYVRLRFETHHRAPEVNRSALKTPSE